MYFEEPGFVHCLKTNKKQNKTPQTQQTEVAHVKPTHKQMCKEQ